MNNFDRRWTRLRIVTMVFGLLTIAWALHFRATTLPYPWDMAHPQTLRIWISDLAGILGLILILIPLSRKSLRLDEYTLGQLGVRGLGMLLIATALCIRAAFLTRLLADGLLQDVLTSDAALFVGFLLAFGPNQTFSLLGKVIRVAREVTGELGKIPAQVIADLLQSSSSETRDDG